MRRLTSIELVTPALLAALLSATPGCGGDDPVVPPGTSGAQSLFVGHEGSLIAYDLATGEERPGAVQNVAGPVDLQALADGTLMVNLTGRDEILCVDGNTMLERARIPSSAQGGKRPVHSYLSPERGGKSYWLTLNDGAEGKLETNSARFVDVTLGSADFMKPVGETSVGVGHHKASFSATGERVVISNIGDCDNVLTVYDYSDMAEIKALATLTAEDAGWDGSSFATTCDPTYQMGVPPAPHGCATSKQSGKAYCNLTSSGGIVAVDIDATPPTFVVVPTGGLGGGYTKTSEDGRYVYSVQEEPREGSAENPGAPCQIGQLVVLDATSDSIAAEVPLFYKGPGCTDVLVGTDEETAGPSHMQVTHDGKTMFITVAGGFGVDTARVRQEVVLDLSNPASPVQLASIPVGASSSHHGDTLSGDGQWLFVANNADGTVTQIDTATRSVVRTLQTKDKPLALATYGAAEGPSYQTGPIH